MTKYTHQARYLAGQLGVPGWVGLVLCIGAAAAWSGLLPQARSEVDDQKQRAMLLREQLGRGSTVAQGASSPELPVAKRAQDAWAHWWRALPDREQGMRMQADVLAAAKAHGVLTQSVQFQGAPMKALPMVWRQQMSLPAEGSYPALRAWLAQLNSQKALSIDSLDINRADPMSDQVKARVTVSLWWRVPALPGGTP